MTIGIWMIVAATAYIAVDAIFDLEYGILTDIFAWCGIIGSVIFLAGMLRFVYLVTDSLKTVTI